MTFWYRDPAQGKKFPTLSCSNWFECNSRFEFSELAIKEDDGFYHVFAFATKFTSVKKFVAGGNADFKLEPQLITFKVAKKDYIKPAYRDRPAENITQSRVEKWLCKLFSEKDQGLIYQGYLDIVDSGQVDSLISGLDPAGKPIPELLLIQLQSYVASLEPTEGSLIKLDELDITSSSGGRSGGYSKGQTELEILNDRLTFIKQQLDKTPGLEGVFDGSVAGILTLKESIEAEEADSKAETAYGVIQTCFDLMFGFHPT